MLSALKGREKVITIKYTTRKVWTCKYVYMSSAKPLH